jgi:signal peptidase I
VSRRPATAVGASRPPISTLLLGVVALLVALVVLGAAAGRWRLVPVLSGSMDPALHAGDLAVVVPESVADVRTGQVIVYEIPIGDRHVEIHRVVAATHGPEGTDVVTRGDANAVADPWIARLDGATAWRLSFRIPRAGSAVLILGRPEFRVAALLLAVGIGLWIGLRRIWRAPVRRDDAFALWGADGHP